MGTGATWKEKGKSESEKGLERGVGSWDEGLGEETRDGIKGQGLGGFCIAKPVSSIQTSTQDLCYQVWRTTPFRQKSFLTSHLRDNLQNVMVLAKFVCDEFRFRNHSIYVYLTHLSAKYYCATQSRSGDNATCTSVFLWRCMAKDISPFGLPVVDVLGIS